jgi:hypothetical protein
MATVRSQRQLRPTLELLSDLNDEELHRLQANGESEVEPEDLWREPESTLFESLRTKHQLMIATGFSEPEIMSLYQLLQPYIVTIRQPGKRPKSSYLNMLTCYLT